MPNESDSEHDASARTGNTRASHTPADADMIDQAGDELERRVAAAVPPQFHRGQGNGGDRGGGGGDGGQVQERRPLRADLGEEPRMPAIGLNHFATFTSPGMNAGRLVSPNGRRAMTGGVH